MRPSLEPGDRLLVVRRRRRRLRSGDLVALTDPRQRDRTMLKRVAVVDPAQATVTVLGDNRAASTDSRTFGPVPLELVRGRAVYRYWPEHRRGRIGH
ncbi:MAG: Signal peptidase [Acidimicrobiales bacterium]|nr:Signal peptidase [Acidimicrobiales bacterium]